MTGPVKASVIVLAYNQATTVGRAIESVLAQKAPFPYEIIIGEDASADSTREVCQDYASRYPDIIRLMPPAPNRGIVGNYFACLAETRGEFISDCAADDYWIHPHKLALEVEAAESAGAVIAFSRYRGTRSDTERWRLTDSRRMLCRLVGAAGALPVMLSASSYRRDAALGAIRHHPDLVGNTDAGCEDMPLMAALLSIGPAVTVDALTLHYTVMPGSASRPSDTERTIAGRIQELKLRQALATRFRVPCRHMAWFYIRRYAHLCLLARGASSIQRAEVRKATAAMLGAHGGCLNLVIDAICRLMMPRC